MVLWIIMRSCLLPIQLVLLWAQLTKIYPPLLTSVQPVSITKTLRIVPTKNERDPPLFTGKLLIKFQNILRNTTQVIIRHRVKFLFSVISSPITLERQKWKPSKIKGILLSSPINSRAKPPVKRNIIIHGTQVPHFVVSFNMCWENISKFHLSLLISTHSETHNTVYEFHELFLNSQSIHQFCIFTCDKSTNVHRMVPVNYFTCDKSDQ